MNQETVIKMKKTYKTHQYEHTEHMHIDTAVRIASDHELPVTINIFQLHHNRYVLYFSST